MKVLFLTKYSPKGASSRYRFYNYRDYLIQSGISPIYKPLLGDIYLKHLYKKNFLLTRIIAVLSLLKRFILLHYEAKKYDHVVIEAEMFPRCGLSLERYFLNKMKSFSFDYDDNIHDNYKNSALESKIPTLMKLANFVTVGNRWFIQNFEGNLHYLPTVIDRNNYPIYDQPKDNKTIVWIGSPSTVHYLLTIEPALVQLADRCDYTLKIIGGTVNLHPKIKVKYIPWSAETENANLANSTVGIMPLMKTNWENGKCGFKLIQYMASGVPVVSTNLIANRDIINDECGFAVESMEEWVQKLELLLQTPSLAMELGNRGRRRVEENYTYQVWGPIYASKIKNHA